MQNERDLQQARSKIELAIRRAAARFPFHAVILERFKIISDPSVETMGVQADGKGVRLYYCATFVHELSRDQLLAVLLHEVHHVLFRHILVDPDEYPDRWARLVAEEVTVNEFVDLPLPDGVIRLEDFPDLPPLESTEQRYARLRRHKLRFSIGRLGSFPDGQADCAKSTVDDHSVWSMGPSDAEAADAGLEVLLDEAAAAVGVDRVPTEFRSAVGICKLDGFGTARLSWQQLLRRYAGQSQQARPVFHRPSRRLPEWLGVVPGMGRRVGSPKVMAVIDTSGSVTPHMLAQISSELSRMSKEFAVTVVECDDAIRAVYPYQPVTMVHGRGGTDLRPPLATDFLRQHRPDLVVYFSDGFGPAPLKPPPMPVIWCLVAGGKPPASWGRVINMQTSGAGTGNQQVLS